MSYRQRDRTTTVVDSKIIAMPYLMTILILALTLIPAAVSSAATNDIGNSNSGTVAQSSVDSTATTGASSSGANNNIKVERGSVYTAPSLNDVEKGVETIQLHSYLGGATISNTELDSRIKMKVELIIDAYKEGLITERSARTRIYLALEEMDDTQKPSRVLFLGPKCRSRSLLSVVCF